VLFYRVFLPQLDTCQVIGTVNSAHCPIVTSDTSGIAMKKCCGNCRQFERNSGKATDLCGAWGHPTKADRQACDFWMMMVKQGKTVKTRKNSLQ